MQHVVTPRFHRSHHREFFAAVSLILLAGLIAHATSTGLARWTALRENGAPLITAALSERDLHSLLRLRATPVSAEEQAASGLASAPELRHLIIAHPDLLRPAPGKAAGL